MALLHTATHSVSVHHGTLAFGVSQVFYDPVGQPPFESTGSGEVFAHTAAGDLVVELTLQVWSDSPAEPDQSWEERYVLELPWPEDRLLTVAEDFFEFHEGFGHVPLPKGGRVRAEGLRAGAAEVREIAMLSGEDAVPPGTERWLVRISPA
ncbi:hypothetical protein [Actinokineospora sp. UTMC 2448]|uniref:hypothetical protein n=1 Tax=Actinokineospora sp. UTMC 2448 TaxID=2268449 RepID=UPI002164511F|nr:hypothetical protein [Actinokineospora sp. UTMC 2448]UVS77636.1 hypothetical protein Actkin_01355 [Actinokineospora sp. UTMC 2448]